VDEFQAHFGTPNRISVSMSHSNPVDRSIGDRQSAWTGYSEPIDLYSRYSFAGGLETNIQKRVAIETGAYLERLENQFWELAEISYMELRNSGNSEWN